MEEQLANMSHQFNRIVRRIQFVVANVEHLQHFLISIPITFGTQSIMATNTPVASNTHTPTTAASTIIQTTRSSGNAATDFPKFPKLPRELRDMIWYA